MTVKLWIEDGQANGWVMPKAPRWKRLPVVRHVRAIYHSIGVSRHRSLCRSLGMIPSGYDPWVLWGMAHGMERDPCPHCKDLQLDNPCPHCTPYWGDW